MFKDIYRQYLAGTGIPEWLGQPSPIGRVSPLVKGKQKPRLSGLTFRHLHHLDCISEMFKGSVFWDCNKHMYHGQMYAYHGMGISSDLSCILKFTGIKPEYLLNPHIEVDWEAIAGVLQLMLIKHQSFQSYLVLPHLFVLLCISSSIWTWAPWDGECPFTELIQSQVPHSSKPALRLRGWHSLRKP